MNIKLGKEEIELDPKLLEFSEVTLNAFLQTYSTKYSYYTSKYAESQYINSCYQDKYDGLYAEKFKNYKEAGGSDKLCEAKTAADPEVQEALKNVRVSKHTCNLLWGYIRSFDRSFENAIQFGYNLRKEMSSLFPTVKKQETRSSN